VKTSDKIFIFGKEPSKESGMMESFPHPKNENTQVRFVKHPETGKLYFNFKDFLKPYKNSKYEKVILNIVPKNKRKIGRIWMSVEAWQEIKTGIEEGYEKDIITGWKERLLF
jgi:hypothetical protein